MSLLQSIFFSKRPPTPKVDEAEAIKEFDLKMREKSQEAKLERDRAARISEYLRCTQEGGDDCRMNISWEELAARGLADG